MGDELGGQDIDPADDSQFDFDSLSDYGKNFLKNYPEEQWPVLGGALKQWDSGFTKKVQEIHSQYAPYKSLGDPEYVSQAVQIANLLQNDPVGIVQRMVEAGIVDPSALGFSSGAEDTPPAGAGAENLPPELMQRFSKYDSVIEQFPRFQQTLEGMAKWVQEQETQRRMQQEDAQVEQLFSGLKQRYGDIDEDFVASRMLKGRTPDEAVQDYQNFVNRVRGDRTPAPTVLGPGGMPRTNKKPSQMSRDEVQSFLAATLQAQNGR